jgi:tetratricopeptide (TPR) repeat protein
MESQIEWLPALVMLAAGVVIGLILIFRFRGGAPPPAGGLEERDLEARRDALVQQLRELEDTEAKLNPQQLAAERYRLELETAGVLRDLAAREVVVDEAVGETGAPEAEPVPRSAAAGFLWGVGATAAVAALIVFVWQGTAPREEGGSLTGNLPMQQSAQADVVALQQFVNANPDNLDARLDLAFAYLMERDLMQVFQQTAYVLQRDSDNARALSYQSLVRLAMGQSAEAEAMLKRALEIEPRLLDGYIHLAIVYAEDGRTEEAAAIVRTGIERIPEARETLETVLRELQRSGGMPVEQGAAAVPAGPTVSGTVDVAPGVALPPTGRLFISVRPAGVAAGPPIAVKMLGGGTLPAQFTISSADSMMGQPLPEVMRIEARLDADGDVTTRGAGDLQAVQDQVRIGTAGIQLRLK